MRIVLMGFIIVLLFLSCGLAVRYNQDASQAIAELESERYKRMVSEESLQRANTAAASLQSELKRVEKKVKNMEVVLEKTKVINKDFRARLDKAAKIKESLDRRIADLQQIGLPL